MSLGIRRIYAIAVIFLPYFTIRFYVIFIKVDRIILSRYATIQIPSIHNNKIHKYHSTVYRNRISNNLFRVNKKVNKSKTRMIIIIDKIIRIKS